MTVHRTENTSDGTEPIALIGIGCKLPGNITSPDSLLQALREGRDLITDIPPDRWRAEAFYDSDPLAPGKTYVRKGGFVEDIDRFDAGFFNISDAEAARMDPQQRMVLQTVWHALEDAGQSAEGLFQSNTSVFLAMMNTNGYSQLKGVYEGPMGISSYDAMGDAMSISAGRISHFLGLEGPCLTLDTACSSSLVALHLARQSILSGECDTAIVVGVNLILHPSVHIAFSKVGLMSRAGRCASFDASADGYIRGEGCVAVLLRRQSQALERGDRIHVSIVGTAVNQDGHTPALTAPNGRSQEKVIRSALARTGTSPNDIGYLEAHGTGTPVGDPIEMSAIVNVFGPNRAADNPLYVGSVKSNFGHLEASAGLLGLVKAALSLEHEEILPSIHFTQLNPGINLGHAPIQVAGQRIPWQRNGHARLASVNSFGYSGTNAHAILQEAPAAAARPAQAASGLTERDGGMLLISAKSAAALEELADRWIDLLEKDDAHQMRDMLYSAALDRSQHNHRLAVVGGQREELKSKLASWRMGRTPQGLAVGQGLSRIRPRLAFMFTGQGAQYAGMGQELYHTEPLFAAALQRVAAVMDPELGHSLLDILFGEQSAQYLENTRYVQPALFAIEYALADLLGHWGIKPDYVIGHSIGELVAACIAGVLDLEDAARFVVTRGRLMGQLPSGGKMLAIGASLEQVKKWVQGREAEVSIATVNGPHSVVVSGTAAAVAAVDELAQAAGRKTKELEVSHAFHSPLMEPILDELTQAAAAMRIHPAAIPIAANASGDFFDDEIPAAYWSSQVRQAVLFHQGMEKIVDAGCTILIEIGPHPALTPAVATAFDAPNLQIIPTLKRDKHDINNLLASLGALYVSGAGLKVERLFGDAPYQHVPLPLYPFRREKYWLAATGVLDIGPSGFPAMSTGAPAEELPALPEPLHPLLGQSLSNTARKTVFETSLKTTIPWTDHRVLEATLFPGTGYLEMAARGFAAAAGLDWRPVELKDVVFERPMVFSYKQEKRITLTLEFGPRGRDAAAFTITSEGVTYCRGRLLAANGSAEKVDMTAELAGRVSETRIGPFYNEMRSSGLDYGANFANVRELWMGQPDSGEAYGRVANGPGVDEADPFRSAILLDGCLHPLGAAVRMLNNNGRESAVVPAALQSVIFWRPLPTQVWSHVHVSVNADGRAALAHLRVLTADGEMLVQIDNFELRRMTALPGAKDAGARSNGSGASAQLFKSRAELISMLTPLSKRERVGLLSKWLTGEIKDIMGQAADGLNLDKLPPSTAFLEIGLDSLLVTELQRRIQEKLEFRFKPMQGLDYQSIESLANYILSDVLVNDLVSTPIIASIPEMAASAD